MPFVTSQGGLGVVARAVASDTQAPNGQKWSSGVSGQYTWQEIPKHDL